MKSYSSDHMLLILQGHFFSGVAPRELFKPQANVQHCQLKIKKPKKTKASLHCEVGLGFFFWLVDFEFEFDFCMKTRHIISSCLST